eukprot:Gb_01659 [translate_table: standard]
MLYHSDTKMLKMDALPILHSYCVGHPSISAGNLPKLQLQVNAGKPYGSATSTVRSELGSSAEVWNYRNRNVAADRQHLFNRIAPNYDFLNDLLSFGQHRVWKRMAVSWSGAKEGDVVLDICCGSGDLTFLLAEKVGCRGKVTGLDFANEQLMIASQRHRDSWKACFRNIEWVQGDALNLPFVDYSFNAVTVGYGLRNVVDITRALTEIYRVLKKGSSVSILDFNRSSNSSTSFIQDWALDNVVVPVANDYGLKDEYAYLKTSIATFATGKEQEKLALEAGFSNAVHYEIGGGFMGVLVATR